MSRRIDPLGPKRANPIPEDESLSSVRSDPVVAVCCSDIHLSDKAPAFRAAEPDWFAAMERQLMELDLLAKSVQAPIICAGDIFHVWNPSPALINFALEYIPHMYCIPGQHDLRLHNYQDIQQTAYWTLVKTGKITNLKPGNPYPISGALLYAFPWGFEVTAPARTAPLEGLSVAVIHKYLWTKSTGYPGADPQARLGNFRDKLAGFDAAIVGDNHQGWSSHLDGAATVLNCGGFFRRNSDQVDYQPRVGLLLSSGKVELHYLDVSQDRVCQETSSEVIPELPNLEEFLTALKQTELAGFDYESVLRCYCQSQGLNQQAVSIVLEALASK